MSSREAYQKYLCSPEWWAKRNAVMERANYCCEDCGREARHVHHLTYIRKFNERLDDLKALCETCHNAIHKPQNTPPAVSPEDVKANRERRAAIDRSLSKAYGLVIEQIRIDQIIALSERLRKRMSTIEDMKKLMQLRDEQTELLNAFGALVREKRQQNPQVERDLVRAAVVRSLSK
jgi:hypothetical protein